MNIDRIVNFRVMLHELEMSEINRMSKLTDNGEQNLNTLLDKEVEQKEQAKQNSYDQGTHLHSGVKKRTAIS